jgi:hypothetical protein
MITRFIGCVMSALLTVGAAQAQSGSIAGPSAS